MQAAKINEALAFPETVTSIGIDGMDQNKTRLPKHAPIPKGIETLSLLKTHITAVKVHGKFVNSYVDYNQFPHDPNLTIHVLMDTLNDLRVQNQLGIDLYLQLDNTGTEYLRLFFISLLIFSFLI